MTTEDVQEGLAAARATIARLSGSLIALFQSLASSGHASRIATRTAIPAGMRNAVLLRTSKTGVCVWPPPGAHPR